MKHWGVVLIPLVIIVMVPLAQVDSSVTQPHIKGDSSKGTEDDWVVKIFKRNELQRVATDLAKQGRYDEAIRKYQEAIHPSLLNEEADAAFARGGILSLFKVQGRYERAMKEAEWFLSLNPSKQSYIDEKLELEALIRARDTGSMQPVYEHIAYLRKKYKNQLPPKGYGSYSEIVASTIIRLYDVIGDLEGGIKFVDSFLNYFWARDMKRYGKIKWGIGDQSYYEIKQAFLQDKAEGRGSCLGMAPNDQCPGRATRALIKSDYFPW